MNFKRKQTIESNLFNKRVLIIYGPRRVGKTTMLNNYLEKQKQETKRNIIYQVGDDIKIRELFASEDRDKLLDFANPYDVVAIDEAQQVNGIGLGIKMIIDAYPKKTIILTGSSSFDLSSKIGEPLTGRHFTLTLLPLSQAEMEASNYELKNSLENFLLYGAYPEILLAENNLQKEKILNELVSSYLYKDVLSLDKIKSPALLKDIAKMIAFQIGQEVSLNEIAVALRTDVKTVGRYLDLLEKMFVIKKIPGFSRNLRNEITKKAKYFFLDLGIRNAVIGQFSPLGSRDDIGGLWENFIFLEFYKNSTINDSADNYFFWRTHAGAEIDIIKEKHGGLSAYECKWNKSTAKIPKTWHNAYPKSSFQVINKEKYLDFFSSK